MQIFFFSNTLYLLLYDGMELLPFVPNNISVVIKKEFNNYKHLCVFNFGFSMKLICIYAGESIYISEETSTRVRYFKGVYFCFFM